MAAAAEVVEAGAAVAVAVVVEAGAAVVVAAAAADVGPLELAVAELCSGVGLAPGQHPR